MFFKKNKSPSGPGLQSSGAPSPQSGRPPFFPTIAPLPSDADFGFNPAQPPRTESSFTGPEAAFTEPGAHAPHSWEAPQNWTGYPSETPPETLSPEESWLRMSPDESSAHASAHTPYASPYLEESFENYQPYAFPPTEPSYHAPPADFDFNPAAFAPPHDYPHSATFGTHSPLAYPTERETPPPHAFGAGIPLDSEALLDPVNHRLYPQEALEGMQTGLEAETRAFEEASYFLFPETIHAPLTWDEPHMPIATQTSAEAPAIELGESFQTDNRNLSDLSYADEPHAEEWSTFMPTRALSTEEDEDDAFRQDFAAFMHATQAESSPIQSAALPFPDQERLTPQPEATAQDSASIPKKSALFEAAEYAQYSPPFGQPTALSEEPAVFEPSLADHADPAPHSGQPAALSDEYAMFEPNLVEHVEPTPHSRQAAALSDEYAMFEPSLAEHAEPTPRSGQPAALSEESTVFEPNLAEHAEPTPRSGHPAALSNEYTMFEPNLTDHAEPAPRSGQPAALSNEYTMFEPNLTDHAEPAPRSGQPAALSAYPPAFNPSDSLEAAWFSDSPFQPDIPAADFGNPFPPFPGPPVPMPADQDFYVAEFTFDVNGSLIPKPEDITVTPAFIPFPEYAPEKAEPLADSPPSTIKTDEAPASRLNEQASRISEATPQEWPTQNETPSFYEPDVSNIDRPHMPAAVIQPEESLQAPPSPDAEKVSIDWPDMPVIQPEEQGLSAPQPVSEAENPAIDWPDMPTEISLAEMPAPFEDIRQAIDEDMHPTASIAQETPERASEEIPADPVESPSSVTSGIVWPETLTSDWKPAGTTRDTWPETEEAKPEASAKADFNSFEPPVEDWDELSVEESPSDETPLQPLPDLLTPDRPQAMESKLPPSVSNAVAAWKVPSVFQTAPASFTQPSVAGPSSFPSHDEPAPAQPLPAEITGIVAVQTQPVPEPARQPTGPKPVAQQAASQPVAEKSTAKPEQRSSSSEGPAASPAIRLGKLEVLGICTLNPDLRLLVIHSDGVYALMGQMGRQQPRVSVLKLFEDNPIAYQTTFVAVEEKTSGRRGLFSVQVGLWRGMISVFKDQVVLYKELG